MDVSNYFLVSKTTKELILFWDNDKSHDDTVSVARDLRLPQFEMQKITTNRCSETNHMGTRNHIWIATKPKICRKCYKHSFPSNNKASFNFIGNYSCLVAEFHLHRSIGYHLIQSYLPSILIVGISWVSFWMDIDCVPARVTLGVITLLTVSGLVSGKGL